MANKIIHKRSFTTGSIPTTASLDVGEIALNVPDGKMYLHKSGSNGQSIESAITSNSTASIGVLTMSGSLILSGSTDINSGSVFDVSADNISFDFDSLSFSGSAEITGSLVVTGGITGSFTGSYVGDGAGLYNIPAGGIVGLNLSQIASGSVSASISPSAGLQVNTNVTAPSFTGSFSGSFQGDGSGLTGVGGDPFPYTGSAIISGSLQVTGSTTTTQLGVGAPPDGTTRLDVRAQGALSTDIAFRVRNSADTANLFEISGTSVFSRGVGNISSNCAYGEGALDANTTGDANTAYGVNALGANTTGTTNTAVGYHALLLNNGIANVAVGVYALDANTTGGGNVAVGRFALSANTTSGGNVAVGNDALKVNTGAENVAIGSFCLDSNTSGTGNTGVGTSALSSQTTQRRNTGLGYYAGIFITAGEDNIFVGHQAGRRNSILANLTSISTSILIGSDSRPLGNAQSNQIVIGYQATGLGSNTAVIGNSSTTRWKLWGAGLLENITAPSASVTDNFHIYSSDITAGNAAPHFRTENGSIIKLYQQSAVSSSQGLADALTNLGLLTGSSTIASSAAFPYTGSAEITGSLTVTGSVAGAVQTLAIVSSTASLDLSQGNFFELTLESGSVTHLSPTNIQPGQTINLKINQPATSGSLTYDSTLKFPGGIPYNVSATGSVVDILSMVSFDSSTLYTTAIKNLS